MATATSTGAPRGSARVHVQKFGTFLSNMVLPNIGAFIAWGLITALFIQTGWIALIGDRIFGVDPFTHTYGFVSTLGAWKDADGNLMHPDGVGADGIVGIMIRFLLPLLIGYTGGRMMYDDQHRGGVVGAIATFGAIAGSQVPMFIGAMVMGPLGGYTMRRLDAMWAHKIRPGFEMLINNFSAGIWGGILAIFGFAVAGPFVTAFSNLASDVVNFLVDHSLLPLTSIFIEPAKILFLNNAINQGILTPLGVQQAAENGKSILFLLEANPGPGLGVLLAYAVFGRGAAKASAPGAILIHFIGGIHEIYFPYVLAKPKLIAAVILGGMTGVTTNLVFNSGLRSPASPGSIIAVWLSVPPSSFIGVTLSVIFAAAVSFAVAAFLLRFDKSDDEGDLSAATAQMESMKGKKSSISGHLTGTGGGTALATRPISSIVFACDAGMGSSAMGASVLRKKIQSAGYGDVTVVNKAISNLRDEFDLVVVHQDLADRASSRTPSAGHVTVDNFMGSPRYDEIVEMIREQRSGGGGGSSEPAAAAPAPSLAKESAPTGGGDVLAERSIVLQGTAASKEDAIREAGQLLVDAGAVEPSYVDAMLEREQSVSTYMGNLLAIPHGTNEAKGAINRTAISLVRYPGGIQWKNKEVQFVVGIAGKGNDHMALLGKIAEVFLDKSEIARLQSATTAAEVRQILGGVQAG